MDSKQPDIREELGIGPAELPVICISAASLNDDWKIYESAGMNSFLEKPFTEEMLMSAILDVTGFAEKHEAEMADINKEAEAETIRALPVDPEGKINLQNLIHISGGDAQFTKQMLITFLETTTRGLREMNEATASEEWHTVADLAHKMLPPAGISGPLS